MRPYIFIKNAGETMNQAIDRFKITYKINNKVCYCGRLDPMARGIILLLVGDDCIHMNVYNKANKTYRFEILFGFSTDTDDMMGIITQRDKIIELDDKIKMIKDYINIGKFDQKFHNFSSKKYKGKSLWWYKLNNISYPPQLHNVEIFDIKYEEIKEYNASIFFKDVIKNINNTRNKFAENNFRQDDIIKQYDNMWCAQFKSAERTFELSQPVLSSTHMDDIIYTLPVIITVSSGFYIRQLVADIMTHINYPITTYDINRIKVLLP